MPVIPTPDFLEGLGEVVAVERDSNADGTSRTAHGYPARVFLPVEGMSAIRARLCRRRGTVRMPLDYPVPVIHWRVLLGQSLAIDLTYRFVWADPDRGGQLRYLEINDLDANYVTVSGMYSAVNCIEYFRTPSAPVPPTA